MMATSLFKLQLPFASPSTKHEARSTKQAQSTNREMLQTEHARRFHLCASNFEFVSAFVLRISCCLILGLLLSNSACADDFTTNSARLQQMTPEQKDDLRRKKLRFDEL